MARGGWSSRISVIELGDGACLLVMERPAVGGGEETGRGYLSTAVAFAKG